MRRIVIKGVEYPCRVTMGAMLRFKRETGKDVSAMDGGDMTEVITFFWCCAASACAADGAALPYGLMDFADAIDPSSAESFMAGLGEGSVGADSKKKKTGSST